MGKAKKTENRKENKQKEDENPQDLPEALKKKKEKIRKRKELLESLKDKGQKNQPGKVKQTKLVQRYTGKRGN